MVSYLYTDFISKLHCKSILRKFECIVLLKTGSQSQKQGTLSPRLITCFSLCAERVEPSIRPPSTEPNAESLFHINIHFIDFHF